MSQTKSQRAGEDEGHLPSLPIVNCQSGWPDVPVRLKSIFQK